jgi:tripartite-type tricarboxylate transporter receptor subunit TctC
MAAPLSDQFGPGGAALRLISQDFARFSRQRRQEFAAKPVEDAAERAGRRGGAGEIMMTAGLAQRSKRLLVWFGICAAALSAPPAAAQTVEQFYKGRTITLFVASAPGGINDLTARLIARHMPDFLAGKPNIVVQNLTGANGLALANRLSVNAEKDGTAIAILERGTPQLAIQGDPNVRFDPLKLTWLGSVSSYANDAYLLQVNASFPAKTVADLKKGGTPARLGTTGAGATNLIFSIISRDVLGLNVQVVRGYPGVSGVFLAQQRAEVDGQINGLSAIKIGQMTLWQSGAFRPLLAFSRTTRLPELPDVPIARELTTDPKALSLIAFAEVPFFMALPIAAPPDLPPERAKALQAAFMDMSRDPTFVAEAQKLGLDVSPIDGDAVVKLIAQMAATPKDVIAQFNEMVAPK